jgi:hypothetical protein
MIIGGDYFQRRARQERAMAEKAADQFARERHLELAERYEVAAAGGPIQISAAIRR